MVINYNISKESVSCLNAFFTKSYDYKQWFFKLKTYDIILKDPQKFVDNSDDAELKQSSLESYKLAIKAEIVFSFFHMAEALFSLIYVCKRTQLPWVFMKHIRFKELCKYVSEEIISGKITDEDIRFLFYNGVVGEEAKKDEIVKSIAFIKDFLKRMGKLFLENEIYQEYKHGLRVMTLNSQFTITPEHIPNALPIVGCSSIAHVYLDTRIMKKEGKEEYHRIQQKTVSFDYELYLRLSIQIFRLMDNLFGTRKQTSELKPEDKMDVLVFHKENLDEIFKENLANKFSLTIDYP